MDAFEAKPEPEPVPETAGTPESGAAGARETEDAELTSAAGARADAKEALVQAAYDIAEEFGVAAVTIREVARRCHISVGAVYKLYPAKSQLTVDAIVRYFDRALRQEFFYPVPHENFVDYCRRMRAALLQVMDHYRSRWLRGSAALPAAEVAAGRTREAEQLSHIRAGLLHVLAEDPAVDRTVLAGVLDAEHVCTLVFDTVMADVRFHTDRALTALALLQAVLYPQPAAAED